MRSDQSPTSFFQTDSSSSSISNSFTSSKINKIQWGYLYSSIYLQNKLFEWIIWDNIGPAPALQTDHHVDVHGFQWRDEKSSAIANFPHSLR